jgi:hypothetical protein
MLEVMKSNLGGDMGSLGDASYRLYVQHDFPHIYNKSDRLVSADDDRLRSWDYAKWEEFIRRLREFGPSNGYLGDSIARIGADRALPLLKFLLLPDEPAFQDREWTGYRVMGTVNRSNGYPVWTLEIFSRGEGSKTKGYSGFNAPNVKQPHSRSKLGRGDYFSLDDLLGQ